MTANPKLPIERKIPTRAESIIFRAKTLLLQTRRAFADRETAFELAVDRELGWEASANEVVDDRDDYEESVEHKYGGSQHRHLPRNREWDESEGEQNEK